ncbi:putative Nuclear factor erythroid 2-related factor 1 [Hypsibius exemplaris]|uniref:Nuclear factor erythroid 2-related factor 1 n=1 Tax=Hypsibius exemplaris TaxID=2072580 RepID=A0A1W0X8E7_HYPEX|nr:putative Nuclear factor erythroid 2-related factor 1 [Hypsibius exemplaris]
MKRSSSLSLSLSDSTFFYLALFLGLNLILLPDPRRLLLLQDLIGDSSSSSSSIIHSQDGLSIHSRTVIKDLSVRGEKDHYLRQAVDSLRSRAHLSFNAELIILTPASSAVVRTGGQVTVSASQLASNISAAAASSSSASPSSSSGSFNAAAEALGDLFMTDIYLQGDLDVEEITAVAAFVTKEDMDVQRLVDVLWSQDIDLGAGRETFEYPIHPPKDVEQKPEPKLEPFPSDNRFGFTSGSGLLDTFFVDDETGEITTRGASGVNDTQDPFSSSVPSNTSQFYPSSEFTANSVAQNANGSASCTLGTDDQLQSLIEALNSLNSSTLQAAVEQGQGLAGKVVEDTWQDVESVISPATSNSFAQQNVHSFNSSAAYPSGNSSNIQSQSNGSLDLNTFDLFSMFMDPPKNWTLPTPSVDSLSNVFNGIQPEYNSSDATGYRQRGPVGVVPIDSSTDMYGMGVRSQQHQPSMLSHEGPFDLSAFSYSQPPLAQAQRLPGTPSPTYVSPPLMDQTNNSIYNGNWNLSDWQSLGSDMNPYQQQTNKSLSAIDYYTNGQLAVMNATTTSWKLLQDLQPVPSGNMSDAFLLLDEAKLQLLDLDNHQSNSNTSQHQRLPKLIPVEKIKQEDTETDPWTEHVNYAIQHNHTYAAPVEGRSRGRRRESREGSEDDHQSFSGSTGSGSGSNGQSARSRQSRDDRAASELRLPVTAEEIIAMPVEEFNGYISGQVANLDNGQIQLMKDIRRRGKNKVAAQNCRRRKIDNMSHLEREIMDLQNELKQAQSRHSELTRERDRYREAIRGSVIQDNQQQGSPTSSGNSVIVMSGGSMVRGVRRQDSGSSDQTTDKPQKKRKRTE